jgi:hypothetical protein
MPCTCFSAIVFADSRSITSFRFSSSNAVCSAMFAFLKCSIDASDDVCSACSSRLYARSLACEDT